MRIPQFLVSFESLILKPCFPFIIQFFIRQFFWGRHAFKMESPTVDSQCRGGWQDLGWQLAYYNRDLMIWLRKTNLFGVGAVIVHEGILSIASIKKDKFTLARFCEM